jgi:hypothetical protein
MRIAQASINGQLLLFREFLESRSFIQNDDAVYVAANSSSGKPKPLDKKSV